MGRIRHARSGPQLGTLANPIITTPADSGAVQSTSIVSSNPVPVTGPITDTQLRATPVAVYFVDPQHVIVDTP